MSKSARQSAFEILYKVERSGAYSNLALDAQLSSKDGADGNFRRDERVIRFLTFKMDKYAAEYAAKRRSVKSNKKED